ncbi:MAG: DUF1343 domain-containing protein [Bacteroidales bacterium]
MGKNKSIVNNILNINFLKKSVIVFLMMLVYNFSFGQNASSKIINGSGVLCGIDVLQENDFLQLRGKNIGLVTNPTGVNKNLESDIDILYNNPSVNLKCLFGPEHGIRGNSNAGNKVKGGFDEKTNLPIYSLYGRTRKPTNEMLDGLDAIVYDIQDIGCRSYTYVSTMGNIIQVAAEHGLEIIILDRPNPLGGNKIEGPIVKPGFFSFVSKYQIPYIYGLTAGELANFLVGEGFIAANAKPGFKLTIVKMEGWSRSMSFEDTGLIWLPTSPHIPSTQSAYLYPATGILGELYQINIGVGYTLPFQLIGAKGVNAEVFATKLNNLHNEGVIFRPAYYTPYYGSAKGKCLGGVQIHITDLKKVNLSIIQFQAMDILHKMYPTMDVFKNAAPDRLKMFDKVCGSDIIRKTFQKSYNWKEIEPLWSADINAYTKARLKYLLYN